MRRRTLDKTITILLICAAVLLLLLVGMAAIYFLFPQSPEPVQELLPLEETQPEETALYRPYDGRLTRADGSQMALSELRGKPAVLFFWSSWCPDCKGYMQAGLEEAFAAARAQGAEAWLVCREGRRGENWQTATASLVEMALHENTLMDPNAALFEQMGLNSVPTMVVLDGQGCLMVATTRMPNAQEMRAMLQTVSVGHQAQSEALFRDVLLMDSGAVPSTYYAQGMQTVRGNDVLSESQGLMMNYAVQANDQPLFDQLYRYVRDEMSGRGLTTWRVSGGVRSNVNASLDDLRILEALALAEERWGGYRQELSYRESALYRLAVQDGHMRDYAPLEGKDTTTTVTLCYLDIAAMERLAATYGKWAAVAENARKVLTGGVISEEFPLYYPRYEPEKDAYTGERLQMNEALVAVYNAARAGIDCTAAFDWLEQQMDTGGIFAMYDLNGRPVRGYVYESTATYAILVQAALEADREDLARKALARLERRRCYTAPLVGDLGEATDSEHYTFDLAETLLAWQRWNAYFDTP